MPIAKLQSKLEETQKQWSQLLDSVGNLSSIDADESFSSVESSVSTLQEELHTLLQGVQDLRGIAETVSKDIKERLADVALSTGDIDFSLAEPVSMRALGIWMDRFVGNCQQVEQRWNELLEKEVKDLESVIARIEKIDSEEKERWLKSISSLSSASFWACNPKEVFENLNRLSSKIKRTEVENNPQAALRVLEDNDLRDYYDMDSAFLDYLQVAVVSSAVISDGYREKTWEACRWLLRCTEDYNRFESQCLLPAVKRAVSTASAHGKWYQALGFVNIDWPNNEALPNLFSSEELVDIFPSGKEESIRWGISPEVARSFTQKEQDELTLFLPLAKKAGFPLELRHQLSGSLLMVLNPKTEDFAHVARVFLDGLLEANLPGLAFVMWRELAEISVRLQEEKNYLKYIKDYVEAGLESCMDLKSLLMPLVDDIIIQRLAESDNQ